MKSYNKRLFSNNFRGFLHFSRYKWLSKKLKDFNNYSILELGCYDGKTLDFINNFSEYIGYDADWEDGLIIANRKYEFKKNISFVKSDCLTNFHINKKYDFSVCMETFEHIDEKDLFKYIDLIVKKTKQKFFITVPIETGFFFFCKHLIKKIFIGSNAESYSFKDIFYLTIGNTKNVKRDEHKGWNYKLFVQELRKNYNVEKVEYLPFNILGSFNFGVAITIKCF